MTRLATTALSMCGVVLLSAHVSYVCVSPLSRVPPVFIASACVATSVSFLVYVTSSFAEFGRVLRRTGVAYPIAFASLSAATGEFGSYSAAYACTPLIFVWIQIAHSRGRVKYDPTTSVFVTTRGAAYALLRSATSAGVSWGGEEWHPVFVRVDRLLPFAVASAETLVMLCTTFMETSYELDTGGVTVYALLKSAVFLSLPLLEEQLR